LEVQKAAKAEGLNTYLVMDAGKTQIASGTRTVLCIGPGRYSCLFSQLRTVQMKSQRLTKSHGISN